MIVIYSFFRFFSIINYKILNIFGFPGGSVIKNLPEMQETLAQPLGGEDPLEKEMVTHSSILAWKIIWTEELHGSLCYTVGPCYLSIVYIGVYMFITNYPSPTLFPLITISLSPISVNLLVSRK